MTRLIVKKSRLFAILATVMLLGIYCGQAKAASSLPAFTLPSAEDGKMVASKNFTGKVLLINFFTTW